MHSPGVVTTLLRSWQAGDPDALNELVPLVYSQLRSIAERHFRSEQSLTLQPTAIVHEAFLRLAGAHVEWSDRVHFLSMAARTMRCFLVDHARTRKRSRRGGGYVPLPLNEALCASAEPNQRVLDLDAALTSFAEFDPRKARILEMFYFAGMTYAEIATALHISEATVHREVRLARAWLRQELSGISTFSAVEVST